MTTNVQRIGRYELVKRLAIGGMGRIWLARTDAGVERYVVIKALDTPGEAQVEMFLDEARVLGHMHHQHIVPLFELGRADDGSHFLAMEYVHGHNAQAAWERALELDASLPLDFALTVVAAAASALHHAHTRKTRGGLALDVVHRDVSLGNVMIGFDGAIKLIDFGIAKAIDRNAQTDVGYVKGKLGYMAPEQVNGSDVDRRTDIYALGVALYELTTMTRPFRVASDLNTLERIRKGDYIAPSKLLPAFPRGLELIIAKALRLDREARFQDADAMRRELEAFGHRQKLMMGDAAIVEVMAQLFDNVEPWIEAGIAEAVPAEVSSNTTIPVDTAQRTIVRRLRAATELADQMVIEVHSRPLDTQDEPSGPVDRTALPSGSADGRAQVATVDELEDTDVVGEGEGAETTVGERETVVRTATTEVGERETVVRTATTEVGERVVGEREGETVMLRSHTLPGLDAPRQSSPRLEARPPPNPSRPSAPNVAAAPSIVPPSAVSKRGIVTSATILAAVVLVVIVVHVATDDVKAAPTADSRGSATFLETGVAPAPPVITSGAASGSAAIADAGSASTIAAAPSTPSTPSTPGEVHIKITTTPADATVLLDGQRLGHTPFEGTMPPAPGPHTLKIRRRGYTSLKLDVELGADLVRDLTLSPAPPGA